MQDMLGFDLCFFCNLLLIEPMEKFRRRLIGADKETECFRLGAVSTEELVVDMLAAVIGTVQSIVSRGPVDRL